MPHAQFAQLSPLVTNPLRRRVTHRHGIPMAPGAFPGVGHLPQLGLDTIGFLRAMRERLGPLFWVEVMGRPRLMWLEEAAIEWLMNRRTSSGIYHELLGDAFGESVIVDDGASHRRARKALSAAFTPRGLGAAEVGPLIAEVVASRLARWQPGQPLSVLEETQAIALQVIFSVLGIPDDNAPSWERLYRDSLLALAPLRSRLPGTPRWRGARARKRLDRKLSALLRRAGAANDDGMVAQMARGRDDNGRGLSERALVHNLRLLLIAGHETSASSMAWMLLHLAHEPALWSALVDSLDGLTELPTTIAGLRHHPYALGLFREAIRVYPPGYMLPRVTTEPVEVRGHRVPAGTSLSISILHFSRNPERYPEPLRIRPERWADKPRPTPIETIQFGTGPHFCLGYHLAVMVGTMTALGVAHHLGQRGLRLRLHGRPPGTGLPRPVLFPLMHPPWRARIALERIW